MSITFKYKTCISETVTHIITFRLQMWAQSLHTNYLHTVLQLKVARHTGHHSKRKNPPHFQVINFRDIIWMRLKATNGTLASRDKGGGRVWGWPRTRAQKLRTFRRTMFSVGWTCQWASERTFHSVIPDSNSFSGWHCVSAQDTTSSKSAQDRRQTKPGNLYNQSDKDNEVWTRTGAMGTAGN